MFKVTSFVDFGPYLKSFNSLEGYIKWLEEQLIDTVIIPSHKFMEGNLSKVIKQTPP